tara:strand:- start:1385 stop:1705 length:321 start_codon:yes stop_codon:yes gene_type:complete
MKTITEEVKWAEGKKRSELPKYTWWSSSKDCSKLGGFTLTNQGQYSSSEVDGSVKVTAHSSAGLSYWKHFDIPLDKIEEFCHALMKVKNFAVKSLNENEQINGGSR